MPAKTEAKPKKTPFKGPKTAVRSPARTNERLRGRHEDGRFIAGILPPTGSQFHGGDDPRRAGNGNRNPAWSIMRWIEELCSVLPNGKMKYPKAKLTLLEDGDDHLKAAAAGIVMRIRKGAGPECFSKAGIPLAANDLDRIFDRFVGKPVQASIVVKAELPPAEALEALAQLVKSSPQIRDILQAMLTDATSDNYAPEVVSEQIVASPEVDVQPKTSTKAPLERK